MRVFIDTNTGWNGGYLSHLNGFLSSKTLKTSGHEIFVYGPSSLQKSLKSLNDNVTYVVDDAMPVGYFKMHSWRKNQLPIVLRKFNPDIHFNPMGWLASKHKVCPTVTMSRNLQPFVSSEIKRVPFFSKERWRLVFAKKEMIKSFNRADGIIFLSDYAQETIKPYLSPEIKKTIIPHGVNEYFRKKERGFNRIPGKEGKINLLYISRVFSYKNHDKVIEAVALLRAKLNLDIHLTLIGGVSSSASFIITNVLKKIGTTSPHWLKLIDNIPNVELVNYYNQADIFVFASSVENFPNILLEAMASGLPIACANRRPMTDILNGAGELFNPNDPLSIASSLEKLIKNEKHRVNIAMESFSIAQNYSYERMSKETFRFFESLL